MRIFRIPIEFLTSGGRRRRYFSFAKIYGKVGEFWQKDGEYKHRAYKNYADYVEHQASKLETLDLRNYDKYYRKELAGRLSSLSYVRAGTSVLCLGARIGSEVKAFLDIGCFAVGIDLNPGKENHYVMQGDFHQLIFPNSSVDIVYTNSLDHALYPKKLFAEIRRVLKMAGIFILDVKLAKDGSSSPEYYEAFGWASVDAIFPLAEGLECVDSQDISNPWSGKMIVFRKVEG
ncbi:MAG: class I SAM-dependent methyltransferase [Candidatus Omnitrophota bacterium]|nr:class I SAM-dependent methyltransferase [Candidatus Omnitrophota bacterium]